MDKRALTAPQVKIQPVLLYLLFIVSGIGLGKLWPAALMPSESISVIADAIKVIGAMLILWASWQFQKHRTTTSCRTASATLISTGPFGYSRNPVYLGLLLLSIGIVLDKGNYWVLLLTIPLIAAVTHFVIRKEERSLEQQFGERYRRYKTATRRWL